MKYFANKSYQIFYQLRKYFACEFNLLKMIAFIITDCI